MWKVSAYEFVCVFVYMHAHPSKMISSDRDQETIERTFHFLHARIPNMQGRAKTYLIVVAVSKKVFYPSVTVLLPRRHSSFLPPALIYMSGQESEKVKV